MLPEISRRAVLYHMLMWDCSVGEWLETISGYPGGSRCIRFDYHQLFNPPTGDPVIVAYFLEGGFLHTTVFHSNWAAGMESTTRRRIQRAGDITGQQDAITF
jgi:hypothetical protein